MGRICSPERSYLVLTRIRIFKNLMYDVLSRISYGSYLFPRKVVLTRIYFKEGFNLCFFIYNFAFVARNF